MIEPRYGVLQTLFADRVFRIPHYQRFYSWQKRQREDLFNDIQKLADGSEDQHHFMATIVCHRTSETKDVGAAKYRVYDVVDGQQRLTTLILLLKSIELAMPASSEDRHDLARTLVKRDGNLILLQTNNANEFNFNRFIREGVEPTRADIETYSDRNLAGAIRECKQFVDTWTAAHNILSLMRLVLHRLGFVVFDTEDNRVVYTIFEVLNSRGLAVDWLDKTKSVLMGRMYDLSASSSATEAEIDTLQGIWGRSIARSPRRTYQATKYSVSQQHCTSGQGRESHARRTTLSTYYGHDARRSRRPGRYLCYCSMWHESSWSCTGARTLGQ